MKRLAAGLVLTVSLLGGARSARADAAGDQRLFKVKCAACHGADGKGETPQGKKMKISDLTSAAWQKHVTDDEIKTTINDGVKREKDGTRQEMKGFKGKLKPEEITALVGYVRSLKK